MGLIIMVLNHVGSMFNFFHTECRGCQNLEPETVNTVARMNVAPTPAEIQEYDNLIKGVKLSQGLCLRTLSLHQRFISFYIRASHDKQASLLDWTKNVHDGQEIGTIRFTLYRGVGGSITGGNSYINDGYTQVDDYFSLSSKFGGYITADFNNRIVGFRTTDAGGSAAELSLALTLGNRIYDSWGTGAQTFETLAVEGLREIERGGTYFNGGFGGNRTLLYQGQEDITISPTTSTFRSGFNLNFYSLALNSSGVNIPIGNPIEINTVGLCMIQYHGSRLINSPKILIPIEKYLTNIGAL